MKSVQISQPNQIVMTDVAPSQPEPGWAVVRVMASGICGTDLHIFRGEFMGSYPVTPGHEFAGEVVAVGEGVQRFQVGDRVAVEPNISCNNCEACLNNRQNFCLHWQAVGVTLPGGMAEYVSVPENAMFDIGDLPYEQAAFMEPLSCVLHGIERAEIRLGDRVAIFGAGPIGILLLEATRLRGASEISMADIDLPRAEFARQMGADVVVEDARALKQDFYDVVIDATGNVPLMAHTVDYARYGGTVLLFGVPPSGVPMEVDPFKIYRKGLKLAGSFTSLRNSYQAVELLRMGRIVVEPIISHRLALGEFARGIELLEGKQEGVRKVMMMPNGE